MRSLSIVSVAIFMALSLPLEAREAGDLSIQAGAALVAPDASSSELQLNGAAVAGSAANVQDATQLGITLRYMWTNSVAFELLASTPFSHSISADTGVLGLGRVAAGDSKHLPPTLSVLWFPLDSSARLQPYLGVGLNYTKFFSEAVAGELEGVLGAGNLSLDDSLGLAASVGLDYALTDRLGFNATLRYIDIDTQAQFQFAATQLAVDVDIDPLVYMLALSYRF